MSEVKKFGLRRAREFWGSNESIEPYDQFDHAPMSLTAGDSRSDDSGGGGAAELASSLSTDDQVEEICDIVMEDDDGWMILFDPDARDELVREFCREYRVNALIVRAVVALVALALKPRLEKIKQRALLTSGNWIDRWRKAGPKLIPGASFVLANLKLMLGSAQARAELSQIALAGGSVDDLMERSTELPLKWDFAVALRQLNLLNHIKSDLKDALSKDADLPLWMPDILKRSEPISILGSLAKNVHVTDFVGRESELDELVEFIEKPDKVSVKIMVGAAGTGKSRLALRLATHWPGLSDWNAGLWIYGAASLKEYSWKDWNARRDCLVIFDTPNAAEAEAMRESILLLASQSAHLQRKVRFLVISRTAKGEWWDGFHSGSEEASQLLESVIDPSIIEMSPLSPEDRTKIAEEVIRAAINERPRPAGKVPTREETTNLTARALKLLRTEDGPQSVIIAALDVVTATHTNRKGRKFEWRTEIGKAILNGERKKWRRECRNKSRLLNKVEAVALYATIFGSVSASDWPTKIVKGISFKRAAKILGTTRGSIFGLRPDIVGEYFLLESANSDILDGLLALAWERDPASIRNFIERTVQDFPHHVSLDRLLSTPPIRFHKFPNALSRQQAVLEWHKFRLDTLKVKYDYNHYVRIISSLVRERQNFDVELDGKIITRLINRAPSYRHAKQMLTTFNVADDDLEAPQLNGLLQKAPQNTAMLMHESGSFDLSPWSYNALARFSAFDRCGELLEEMVARNVRPSHVFFDIWIANSSSRDRTLRTQRLFDVAKKMIELRHYPSRFALSVFARGLSSEEFEITLNTLSEIGYRVPQNALTRLIRESNDPFLTGQRFYERLRDNGRNPSKQFMSEWLDSCEGEEFNSVLELMKSNGYPEDVVVWTARLRRADGSEAKTLFTQMVESGVSPDELLLGVMMQESDGFDDAKHWFDLLEKFEISPNEIHYDALLRSARNGEAALGILDSIQAAGLDIDARHLAATFALKDVSWEQKQQLFDRYAEVPGIVDARLIARMINQSPDFDSAIALDQNYAKTGLERPQLAILGVIERAPLVRDILEYIEAIEIQLKRTPWRYYQVWEIVFDRLWREDRTETFVARFVDLMKLAYKCGNSPPISRYVEIFSIASPAQAAELYAIVESNSDLHSDTYLNVWAQAYIDARIGDKDADLISAFEAMAIDGDVKFRQVGILARTFGSIDVLNYIIANSLSYNVKIQAELIRFADSLDSINLIVRQGETFAIETNAEALSRRLILSDFEAGERFLADFEESGGAAKQQDIVALISSAETHSDAQKYFRALTKRGFTRSPRAFCAIIEKAPLVAALNYLRLHAQTAPKPNWSVFKTAFTTQELSWKQSLSIADDVYSFDMWLDTEVLLLLFSMIEDLNQARSLIELFETHSVELSKFQSGQLRKALHKLKMSRTRQLLVRKSYSLEA